MSVDVYTNYWVNRRDDVKKEHGSYKTEEEALEAIRIWWDIQGSKYKEVESYRTNTGALEVNYGFDNYFYRIEKNTIDRLPEKKYQLKNKNQINATRSMHQLDEDYLIFDELPEPHRDRIIASMADIKKAREYVYTKDGKPVVNFE